MKPSVYVRWRMKRFGPFECGEPELPPVTRWGDEDMMFVGEIVSNIQERVVCLDGHTADVFQDVVSENGKVFCPSEWTQHPPDRIWDKVSPRYTDGGDILLLSVTPANMEWEDTAFEHRYRYFCNGRKCPLLKHLSEEEALNWGAHEEFILFKSPNPGGYQGVLGDFGFLTDDPAPPGVIYVDALMDSIGRINVHDKNDPTHLLEVG